MKGNPLHGCRAERSNDVRSSREVPGNRQDLFQHGTLVDVVRDDDWWVCPPVKPTNQITACALNGPYRVCCVSYILIFRARFFFMSITTFCGNKEKL